MARTDVIVLGAGIVGTSIAVYLAKRGLAVALIDRGGVGEAVATVVLIYATAPLA